MRGGRYFTHLTLSSSLFFEECFHITFDWFLLCICIVNANAYEQLYFDLIHYLCLEMVFDSVIKFKISCILLSTS